MAFLIRAAFDDTLPLRKWTVPEEAVEEAEEEPEVEQQAAPPRKGSAENAAIELSDDDLDGDDDDDDDDDEKVCKPLELTCDKPKTPYASLMKTESMIDKNHRSLTGDIHEEQRGAHDR